MAKKQKHEKEPNLERWLVSYADFITLLFAVFVVLYAMSQSDKQKVEEVSKSIREAFGMTDTSSAPAMHIIDSIDLAPIPAVERQARESISAPEPTAQPYAEEEEFSNIKKEISGLLAAKGNQDKIKLTVTKRGLVISLKEAGFFDSGSAEMQPASLPLLEEIAKSIQGYANDVRIEGHTDNVPVNSKTIRSNWELSTARSTSIVRYLIDDLHFPPARLSAVGYGEYRPIADNSTESGRAQNRRVDIVLLSKAAQQGEPQPGIRPED
ncbi:MAG: OmpA family protein [Desulfobulbaceae bacterium]|nr:OmpA family protein [Desulfobulbaceae bacterium]